MMAAFPLQGGTEGDRAALPSLMHAGTAEPLRVSPPEAVAYPLELSTEISRARGYRDFYPYREFNTGNSIQEGVTLVYGGRDTCIRGA